MTGWDSKAHFRFHDGVALPDATVTPGKLRTTDIVAICHGGSTKLVRHTTPKMKARAYKVYGIDKTKMYPEIFCTGIVKCDPIEKFTKHRDKNGKLSPLPLYEVDHNLALFDGGADVDDNLSPQPYYAHPGAGEKDKLELWAHPQICNFKMTPEEARIAFADDWYELYLKMRKLPDGTSGAN